MMIMPGNGSSGSPCTRNRVGRSGSSFTRTASSVITTPSSVSQPDFAIRPISRREP